MSCPFAWHSAARAEVKKQKKVQSVQMRKVWKAKVSQSFEMTVYKILISVIM